jgi:hypothetical protein
MATSLITVKYIKSYYSKNTDKMVFDILFSGYDNNGGECGV